MSARLTTMPNVLAGPVLRQVTPESVTVWFALKRKATVTLTVLDPAGTRVISGQRTTTALGKNLHIVAVTARRAGGDRQLVENLVYRYDAAFSYPASTSEPAGSDPSIAAATKASLSYLPFDKPSFCMPPADINRLRIIHGSCRKASGDGKDALALVSPLIAQMAQNPLDRPHQLLMTGDQIYADDVAAVLLIMLTDAAIVLMEWDELMPTLPLSLKTSALPPYARRIYLENAKFTSEDLDTHLLSLGEYLCMYLFAWSDVMWTTDDKMANPVTVLSVAQPYLEQGDGEDADDARAAVLESVTTDYRRVLSFRSTVAEVRRVLANIPSYMIFDDHEVTDDWNMTLDKSLDLHGTLLGRRVVQNALVAYTLCQHWGNVPDQFLESSPSLPGTKLLTLLDGKTSDQYIAASPAISSIVSVHTDTDIQNNQGSVYHEPGALTYNYTVEGPAHQVIVTDTRTFRSFPRGGDEGPDLLSPFQLEEQLKIQPKPLNGRALIVVLSTNAPPVMSIRSATAHDRISNHFRHFPDIHEAWEIPSMALDRLVKILSDKLPFTASRSSPVILLSGDVHHAFASRLHYRARNRFGDKTPTPANLVIAQLVASSFKKQTGDTLDMQRQGYRYAPKWYLKALIPVNQPEYFVGWNLQPGDQWVGVWGDTPLILHDASTVALKNLPIPRQIPDKLNVPPDFSYQLDYLRITNGGGAVAAPVPLPPMPANRVQAAKVFNTATNNYRQYNIHPGGNRQIIGVNNVGELTFDFPAGGSRKVNHTVRFIENGTPLFVDYVVNLEAVDPDHPTDPTRSPVTP